MNRSEQIRELNRRLLAEMPQYRERAAALPADDASQRRLLRALMNVRPPLPLSPAFLEVQDALLSAEREARGVVDGEALPAAAADPRLALWQGDITRLRVDAIVNAANSALLGCFVPCHGCIDNAIHSAAGLQLREACSRLMQAQNRPEPNGRAKLTGGYNLPARYVLHTVGPVVRGRVSAGTGPIWPPATARAWSWRRSGAFAAWPSAASPPASSTSPTGRAAEIAVDTVRSFLDRRTTSIERVIFNVFKDLDAAIYRDLLQRR